MLSGGAESRSAALLPGRISWSIGLRGLGLELRLRQDCCIADQLVLLLRPFWPLSWLPGWVVGALLLWTIGELVLWIWWPRRWR